MKIKIEAAQRLRGTTSRRQAMQKDKKTYVKEDNGEWCVVGDVTGVCYEILPTKAQAEEIAKKVDVSLDLWKRK